MASTQCFVFIPSWPVCLLPCVFHQSCHVLTLVHLTFSPSFSCHQCFSPCLPPPPQARCLPAWDWPLLSSWCNRLDSTVRRRPGPCGQCCPRSAPPGALCLFGTLTPGAETAKAAPGTSLWAWRIPKKTRFQAQVSILPNDTGRFRPTSTVHSVWFHSVWWIPPTVMFYFCFKMFTVFPALQYIHQVKHFTIHCYSMVFIGGKKIYFLAAKRFITNWFLSPIE